MTTLVLVASNPLFSLHTLETYEAQLQRIEEGRGIPSEIPSTECSHFPITKSNLAIQFENIGKRIATLRGQPTERNSNLPAAEINLDDVPLLLKSVKKRKKEGCFSGCKEVWKKIPGKIAIKYPQVVIKIIVEGALTLFTGWVINKIVGK